MTIPAHHNLCVRLTCGVWSVVVATAPLSIPAEVRAQVQDHSAMAPTGIDAAAALPHNIPDFCATATISSVGSGAWSNPTTWSPPRVPGGDDVVNVAPGTNVSYDISSSVAIPCLAVNGRLAFRTDLDTRLTVGTLMIMRSGELEVGSVSAPVGPGFTAEVVVANQPINTASDPEQFGTGVLGFGIVTMHGAPKTPTWTRVAQEPRAGNTTLTLSQPVSGWRAGDRLILPDTRHLKWNEIGNWWRISSQTEERTVASISPDGRTLTLNQALQFDHLGARDTAGTLRLLPHVGNLTRNVSVRSQAPIGSGVQGHVLFTERADVDIRYAAFRDLGRTIAAPTGSTNQIGRYPMHFHHLMGPVATPANGYQYTFVGNAVDGGSTNHQRRWAVAIHNTHYGLVSDNVAYNYGGALFTTEDGSESYNVIGRNFAVRSTGTGGRLGDGNEGMGFWFRGPNNYVRGNVAAHFDSDEPEAAYGYKYFMRLLGTIRIPTAKGQDSAQYVARDGNAMPILEFKNNEVYSAGQGLTYWWLSSQDPVAAPNPKESVFEDLRIWHVFNVGVYHYPAAKVRFERMLILGRDPASSACCKRGWHGEDYSANDIRIVNSEIQGMGYGVIPSGAGTGIQAVENSLLDNEVDLSLRTMYSANGPGWLPPRKTVLTNNLFRGTRAIQMDWNSNAQTNSTQRDELLVYAYQRSASDNFQVYYNEQGTQNVAGGRAPCLTTRPEIDGIVCAISGVGTPTVTSVTPSSGDDAGGTSVTINGSNFAAGATVSFGGSSATGVVANSASRITATSPAHPAGVVDVTVRNTDGRSATLANAFTYVDNSPCTYSIAPTSSTLGAGAGTGSVSVTAGAGCSWTAISNATWITVTSGGSGSGNSAVGFSVSANTGTSSRSGTISVAGHTFTVTQQGQSCSFTVSPTSHAVAAAGGARSVTITAPAGCSWTAVSNVSWIGVTSSPTGSGSGTVTCTVDPNTGPAARTGTLTIAGQTVTVTQDAPGAAPPGAIGIDFVGDNPAMGAAESAGVVTQANWNTATGATRSTPLALKDDTGAATAATVTWTADNTWSTPITDQAGNRRLMKGYLDTDTGLEGATRVTVAGLPAGAYDIYVYADGDNSTASRTGSYQISGAGITTTTITLTDPANTNFTGTFTQANNSTGNYVKFSITAGGFTLTATPGQSSDTNHRAPVNRIQIIPTTTSPCTYAVSPTSAAAAAGGEARSTSVTTQAGCGWTATSNNPSWLSVTTGSSGTGNGTVSYSVAPNSSPSSRTGTLTVAGQTLTVTQAACSYTVSPTSDTVGLLGGAKTVTVMAPAGCSWTATSNVSWMTITAGASGSGQRHGQLQRRRRCGVSHGYAHGRRPDGDGDATVGAVTSSAASPAPMGGSEPAGAAR